jgi:hypothetical protein
MNSAPAGSLGAEERRVEVVFLSLLSFFIQVLVLAHIFSKSPESNMGHNS